LKRGDIDGRKGKEAKVSDHKQWWKGKPTVGRGEKGFDVREQTVQGSANE